MSDFRPDTRRGGGGHFFLGSLVQSCCREGGTVQTNNTNMCSQCLSHTGPAPAHGVCALPSHPAQALGCSSRTRPRPAQGCVHLPGLSRSGSGTRVVLRGADSVRPAFCALPRYEHPCVRVMRCLVSAVTATYHLPTSLPLSFLGVHPAHLLRQMLTVQNPKKS